VGGLTFSATPARRMTLAALIAAVVITITRCSTTRFPAMGQTVVVTWAFTHRMKGARSQGRPCRRAGREAPAYWELYRKKEDIVLQD